ncbi:uncharacterized protein VTP21DRAFT_8825 [Calcarisporiella thermophila]|uniref:uncharacterized protein n=1 Tax=Calcarisporiella thermophila TaxID=911321 RepID=UPI0037437377
MRQPGVLARFPLLQPSIFSTEIKFDLALCPLFRIVSQEDFELRMKLIGHLIEAKLSFFPYYASVLFLIIASYLLHILYTGIVRLEQSQWHNQSWYLLNVFLSLVAWSTLFIGAFVYLGGLAAKKYLTFGDALADLLNHFTKEDGAKYMTSWRVVRDDQRPVRLFLRRLPRWVIEVHDLRYGVEPQTEPEEVSVESAPPYEELPLIKIVPKDRF